jgi:hypothetical protein
LAICVPSFVFLHDTFRFQSEKYKQSRGFHLTECGVEGVTPKYREGRVSTCEWAAEDGGAGEGRARWTVQILDEQSSSDFGHVYGHRILCIRSYF